MRSMCEYIKLLQANNTIRNFLCYENEKVTLNPGQLRNITVVLTFVMRNMSSHPECLTLESGVCQNLNYF